MSSTFKFHSTVGETVPWNATYAFPTQATKVQKSIVKIPTKTGGTFTENKTMRIEFPSDGYLNMQNSVLCFDVNTTMADGVGAFTPTFQKGGLQNVIKRLRIMYGSLVLEDIQEYKTLVRLFTELGVQNDYKASLGTVLDGMIEQVNIDNAAKTDKQIGEVPSDPDSLGEVYSGRLMSDPNQNTRTYCLNLLSGLLTCKKLIPLKWMASQLAIEITLASNAESMISKYGSTYTLSNVNFIAEMLEFDSSYDKAFFMGLQQGIPLKFSSWHYHQFTLTGSNQTVQIHERSRSVKAAYAVIRSQSVSTKVDSDIFYHATGWAHDNDGYCASGADQTLSAVQEFQWRVGGRYYPSQPVRATGGGSEALVELLKTINYLGNYTVASGINMINYTSLFASSYPQFGCGSKFIMACEFENTDVMPDTIAGINAEEQSDIALTIKFSGSPLNKKLDVFIHYDSLIIIKEGNVVDLVL
jgi:hypothetical protein